MSDYIQVFTTTDKKENAHSIAREIIEKRLAACAQIVGPITSIFRWQGNLDEEEEWLLIMKTRNDLYKELEDTIKGIHSYEVPELLALPVVNINKGYLEWLDSEVKSISSG